MTKKIIIAAGGTGGHLFPAQALAGELKEQLPDCKILFLAKGLKENPRFNRELFSSIDISANRVAACPRTLLRACVNIPRGIWQSIVAMRQFAPDLVVGFGSFHTFPVLCAASMLGVPMMLHVADCVPGRVNRFFSKKAVMTGVFFPEAKRALKGTVCQTTIPLRAEFYEPLRPSRHSALVHYGLSENKKTVLVFGGSQGASKLNQLASLSIRLVAQKKELQLLHFTGNQASSTELCAEYAHHGITAVVQDFEHQMQYAWAAADLVIARAGASTIAEQMAFSVPGILIPYPYATDQHQEKNARYFEKVVGGARHLQENELEPQSLAKEIEMVLEETIHQEMVRCMRLAQGQIEEFQFSKQVVDLLTRRQK